MYKVCNVCRRCKSKGGKSAYSQRGKNEERKWRETEFLNGMSVRRRCELAPSGNGEQVPTCGNDLC